MSRKQWKAAGAEYRYLVYTVGESGEKEITLERTSSLETAENTKQIWTARGYRVEIFDFESAEKMPAEVR